MKRMSRLLAVVAVLLSIFPVAVRAQNHYALEITNIKSSGSTPAGLDADNRIYFAYPA